MKSQLPDEARQSKEGLIMKGFIEVTDKAVSKKMLISVANIKCINQKDEDVFICLAAQLIKNIKQPWVAIGYSVTESYEEVIAKIKEAIE